MNLKGPRKWTRRHMLSLTLGERASRSWYWRESGVRSNWWTKQNHALVDLEEGVGADDPDGRRWNFLMVTRAWCSQDGL